MHDPVRLLEACEHCYAYPMYAAGPEGRDAATISKIDGRTVLAFRGTLTGGVVAWLDWLNDLRAELRYHRDYPGLVHAGFAASIDNLLLVLPRFSGSTPPIVTGHSKGGALAVLFAMRLFAKFGITAEVVTFAAPRAGNDDLAAACNEALSYDRYENPHDLVPRLPLTDYRHAGYLITPPATWTAPKGIRENHALDTGYRPWIEPQRRQPAGARAA